MTRINKNILAPIGDRVKASKPGRVCKYKGCEQVLSIYNHGRYCYIHRQKMVIKGALNISRFIEKTGE